MKIAAPLKALLFRNTPVYVHYGLTHRCNLTCQMCGLWRLGQQRTELNIVQIRSLARNLNQLGTMAISLGGGEPFLRPDLPEIVRAFLEQGIETRLLTNGLVKNYPLRQQVADVGLKHISISLDTPDPEKQSEICNKPHIWHDIIAEVDWWSKILARRGGIGILNCVISRRNLEDFPQMLKIAEDHGFMLSLVPIEVHQYQEEKLSCGSGSRAMLLDDSCQERLQQFAQQVKNAQARVHSPLFNSRAYLQGMLSYLAGRPPQGLCQAGALSFSISPEGLYSMCHYYKGCGNGTEAQIQVAAPDFPEWYRRTQPARLSAPQRRKCSRCFRPCWQEIALAFTEPAAFANAVKLKLPDLAASLKNFGSGNHQ